MSGRSLKLFALALAFATVGIAGSIKDDSTLKRIAGYRDWSRVTQKPIVVDFGSIGG